jgi:hypothetical protein
VLDGLAGLTGRDRPLLVFEVLHGGADIVDAFAARLPADYAMFLLQDIKRRQYAVAPWRGEAGDVVACAAEHRAFFDHG